MKGKIQLDGTVLPALQVAWKDCMNKIGSLPIRDERIPPLLGRLADFRGPKIDVSGAEAFAGNPHLVGRLRALSLSSPAEHGDSVAAALSKAPGLSNLESFTFCDAGPLGVAAIAASPHLAKVKTLHFHGGPVGDDGAEALAASPHLSAVDHIMLNRCKIGDRGAAALANS